MSPFSSAEHFCLVTAPNEEQEGSSLRRPKIGSALARHAPKRRRLQGRVESNFTSRLWRFDAPDQRGIKIERRQGVKKGGEGKKGKGKGEGGGGRVGHGFLSE